MAEIDYVLTNDDVADFVGYVFELGCHIIPDHNYDEASYIVCKDIQTYNEHASQLFFIIHEHWFVEDFEMGSFFSDIKNKTLYTIHQRIGGPTIDFYCCGDREKEGVKLAGSGSLSHYSSYWSNEEDCYIKPPQVLRDCYKKMNKFLKAKCVKYKSNTINRTYWVTNSVYSGIYETDRNIHPVK